MGVIGAVLGDIAGSYYEFKKPDRWDTCSMFPDGARFTDDTVLTLAVKYSLLHKFDLTETIREFALKYPYAGYGSWFQVWIRQKNPQPYNSYGNGSAMRVSFVGEYYENLEDVIRAAEETAVITHNHPEGIKGAVVTAVCVWMAKHGKSKQEIYEYVLEQYPSEQYEFSIDKTLDYLIENYSWDVTCQGSVPVAMRCFYESHSFEDFMRKLYQLNCDMDLIKIRHL